MSANFAYDQVPPEYSLDEPPERDDDEPEGIAPPDAPLLARPSAEQLIGACIALGHARLKYLKDAEHSRKVHPQHAEFWEKRAADTLVAIEWLERGAP